LKKSEKELVGKLAELRKKKQMLQRQLTKFTDE